MREIGRGEFDLGEVKESYRVGDFEIRIRGNFYDIYGEYSKEIKECLNMYVSLPRRKDTVDVFVKCVKNRVGDKYDESYLKFAFLSNFIDVYSVVFSDDRAEDVYVYKYPLVKLRGHGSLYIAREGVPVEYDDEKIRNIVSNIIAFEGKTIGVDTPMIDSGFMGHRIYAWTDDVARHYGAIMRRFPEEPPTLLQLIRWGAMPYEIGGLFWYYILNGIRTIIVGAMGSGKTTFMQSLLTLVPEGKVIVTAENVPELRLPQKSWYPYYTRELVLDKDVMMTVGYPEILVGALRTKADYIVVGECRWEETRILVMQYFVFGTFGMTTFHARSLDDAVKRITRDPISIPDEVVADSIDVLIFMQRLKSGKRVVYDMAKPVFRRGSVMLETVYYPYINENGEMDYEIDYDALMFSRNQRNMVNELAGYLETMNKKGLYRYRDFVKAVAEYNKLLFGR